MVAAQHAGPARVRQIDALGDAGGFRLKESLTVAIRIFGRPGGEQFTPSACEVSWPSLHLSVTFIPGRSVGQRHRSRTCSPHGRASSIRGGATWSTTGGLRVGAPVTAIARRYPGLERPFQTGYGYSYYALVPRAPTVRGTALRAEAHTGRVDAIIVVTSFTFACNC